MVVLFDRMKHDPQNPGWEGRDYFILSKGQAAETYYTLLERYGSVSYTHLLPRRITGNCAKHQIALTVAIKRARQLAMMPYIQD